MSDFSYASDSRKRCRANACDDDEREQPIMTSEALLSGCIFSGSLEHFRNILAFEEDDLLEPQRRVSSLEDGGFQSADFVLDAEGKAAVCSMCFENNDKPYGLTVGHLADLGDPIFCFVKSLPVLDDDNDDGKVSYSYEIMQMGTVVSKDVETDSLIFDISNPYVANRILPEVDPRGIPGPELQSGRPAQYSKAQMACSLRRDISNATVCVSYNNFPGIASKIGDIGFVGCDEDGYFGLTGPGDAGALFFDTKFKTLAVHHATSHKIDAYESDISFGVPLTSIIARHDLLKGALWAGKYFSVGNDFQDQEQQDAAPPQLWDDTEIEVESRDFAYFKVRIVNPPYSFPSKATYWVWE